MFGMTEPGRAVIKPIPTLGDGRLVILVILGNPAKPGASKTGKKGMPKGMRPEELDGV